jgi:Ca2+-binding EF-hand superfamily protein
MSAFAKLPLDVQRDYDKYAREIDADHNYIIDIYEMKRALRKYGLKGYTDEQIKECMASLDQNGDGLLSLDEFKEFLAQMYFATGEDN